MELDAAQVKPKKEVEKEKSSLTERLEVAMSSLVNVFPETDLDFLVSIILLYFLFDGGLLLDPKLHSIWYRKQNKIDYLTHKLFSSFYHIIFTNYQSRIFTTYVQASLINF